MMEGSSNGNRLKRRQTRRLGPKYFILIYFNFVFYATSPPPTKKIIVYTMYVSYI
jgi:hypothetical protein